MNVDVLTMAVALIAFFALVIGWLVLPESSRAAEPSRVAVSRRSAAEA
jgi:hypothetical protein